MNFIDLQIRRTNVNNFLQGLIAILIDGWILYRYEVYDVVNWYDFLYFVIFFIGAFGLWKVSMLFYYLKNPESHPIIKNLLIYGEPALLKEEIESEIRNKSLFMTRKIIISSSWIIYKGMLKVNLVKLTDVAWHMKK